MPEEAVTAFESAARLADSDNPDLPQYLSNLSNALVDRFTAGRDDDDLVQAVAAAERAVNLVPRRSPDRTLYLNNFASALLKRYEHRGAAADLDTAISALRTAVRNTARRRRESDPDDRAVFLANLAIALRSRFRHRQHRRDLRAAASACRHAVQYTPPWSLVTPTLTPATRVWQPLVMEQFRAVLWTLAVGDLDRPGRPDLARRYRRAAAALAPLTGR